MAAISLLLNQWLLLWFLSIYVLFTTQVPERGLDAPMEMEHAPLMFTTTDPHVGNGSDVTVPPPHTTPDFRIEETLPFGKEPGGLYYGEHNRPFRMSPFAKQKSKWWGKDHADLFGCYCTTVFKRLRLLAGCAVITTRHLLTTATSTEMVLRKRLHFRSLENVLGAWYDHTSNTYNSSMYMTPCRINYHPRYTMPQDVNRSHPLPVMFDLAVWTATYRFSGSAWGGHKAAICNRGSAHKWDFSPPTPNPGEFVHIFGFQFIRAYNRKPLPWFKYVVRTTEHIYPCPKVEWGWYHCYGGYWAPLGLDQGAALHKSIRDAGWRHDGLIGLNAVSMKLRSKSIVHYFTNVDSHAVLDWLYDVYCGKQDQRYLDSRFEPDKGTSPKLKRGYHIPWNYPLGDESEAGYSSRGLPNYN